jgi:hypothetical protein
MLISKISSFANIFSKQASHESLSIMSLINQGRFEDASELLDLITNKAKQGEITKQDLLDVLQDIQIADLEQKQAFEAFLQEQAEV